MHFACCDPRPVNGQHREATPTWNQRTPKRKRGRCTRDRTKTRGGGSFVSPMPGRISNLRDCSPSNTLPSDSETLPASYHR